LITIGRGEDNDIALADPHVSRSHVKLACDGGVWTLISTGRHGTLVDDRVVSKCALQHGMVFRLGAAGPVLRFDTCAPETRRSETMDNIDYDMFANLEVDELRKQQEVDQITSDSLFQQLQSQLQRRKSAVTNESDDAPADSQETI
jgi:pSer/pThr/pTyr-binding forkhead associated (FHA) protein